MNTTPRRTIDGSGRPELAISPATVRLLIDKLREYDAHSLLAPDKEGDGAGSPHDSLDDDQLREHELDYLDEPLLRELHTLLDDLSDDEKIDLVAIAWTGRSGLQADDWASVRQEAADSLNERTVDYLLGTAGVANLLDDGLAALGFSPVIVFTDRSGPRSPGGSPERGPPG